MRSECCEQVRQIDVLELRAAPAIVSERLLRVVPLPVTVIELCMNVSVCPTTLGARNVFEDSPLASVVVFQTPLS